MAAQSDGAGWKNEKPWSGRADEESAMRATSQAEGFELSPLDLQRKVGIEAEQKLLERRLFEPRGLLDDVTQLFNGPAERDGLPLFYTVDSRMPEVLVGDERRLSQTFALILSGLVGTGLPGRITVSVELGAEQPPGVWVDWAVEHEVRDAFDDESPPGSGLSSFPGLLDAACLTACADLVGLMAGNIKPVEQINGRARLRFSTLHPCSTDRRLPGASVLPLAGILVPGSGKTRRPRVLVAEDDPLYQALTLGLLEELGVNTNLVEDGAQAVEAARRGGFDLVLMDCMMPVMDGFESTQRIRIEEQQGRRVPIIALSVNVGSRTRPRCEEVGMDDYLSKPVSLLDLRETLARWIEGSVERSQFGGHEDLTASSLGREARDSSIEEEPADLDVFDPQIALALLDGRRSMTAEVIGRFHVSLEGKVAVLLGALEHGEIKKAHLAAHSLRAGAAHVGASGLCRRFEALEAALDARDLGGAQALTSDLSVQVVRTLQAIGPWLMAQAEQPEGGAGVAAERAASQNPSD